MKKGLYLTILSMILAAQTLIAQSLPTPLTDTERSEVVDSVSRLLNDNYVFP